MGWDVNLIRKVTVHSSSSSTSAYRCRPRPHRLVEISSQISSLLVPFASVPLLQYQPHLRMQMDHPPGVSFSGRVFSSCQREACPSFLPALLQKLLQHSFRRNRYL